MNSSVYGRNVARGKEKLPGEETFAFFSNDSLCL